MVVYADQGGNQRYGDQPKYTCYRNSLMSACTLGSGLLKSIFISGQHGIKPSVKYTHWFTGTKKSNLFGLLNTYITRTDISDSSETQNCHQYHNVFHPSYVACKKNPSCCPIHLTLICFTHLTYKDRAFYFKRFDHLCIQVGAQLQEMRK